MARNDRHCCKVDTSRKLLNLADGRLESHAARDCPAGRPTFLAWKLNADSIVGISPGQWERKLLVLLPLQWTRHICAAVPESALPRVTHNDRRTHIP